MSSRPPLNLRNLLRELEEVIDWKGLGIEFGIPYKELLEIEQDRRGITKECKRDMLHKWLCRGNPTWSDVVKALRGMKEVNVAEKTEERCCHDSPKQKPKTSTVTMAAEEVRVKPEAARVHSQRVAQSYPSNAGPSVQALRPGTHLESHAPVPSSAVVNMQAVVCSEEATRTSASNGYYDFVLVGRTGIGKSTTGNKLLQIEQTNQSIIRQFDEGTRFFRQPESGEKRRFPVADDFTGELEGKQNQSVTKKLELLSNDATNVRVLDVSGFPAYGGLGLPPSLTVYEVTFQIFRWIICAQERMKLNVQRLLYFLPGRGYLEKGDGTLKEELRAMHYFFGESVFNIMVIAATNPAKQKYQNCGFDDEDYERTTTTFRDGLRQAIKSDMIRCPPIVYISANDSGEEILRKIKAAPVLKDEVLPLNYTDDVCPQCAIKIRYGPRGKRVGVVYPSGEFVAYDQSKCHPTFVQKYSALQKFTGGVAHAFTLGVPMAFEKTVGSDFLWPGFTNSDVICPICERSPGSKGCCQVGKKIEANWMEGRKPMRVTIDHDNKMKRSPKSVMDV